MSAPAPSRPILSTTFGLGPIVIPVQIFSGEDDGASIRRSEYTADGEKVGRISAIKNEDGTLVRIVENHEVVKRYECADGQLVELTDEEIQAVLDNETGISETLCFLPMSLLKDSTYVQDRRYQVRPARRAKGKTKVDDPKANQAFALLAEGMRREDVFALVQITLRGVPRYAALVATAGDVQLVTLKYDDEIREPRPLPEVELSDAEVDMARTLIQFSEKPASEAPVLENSAAEKVRQYAETKAKSGHVAKSPDPDAVAAPVTDLMSQLQAAVAAAKGGK
jgi:non-homologous end joining protein Ku